MTTGRPPIEPIRKQVHVPLVPDRAFEVFTAEMGAWWPLTTHSVGLAQAETVTFEAGEGGRIIERLDDGTTSVWGTVVAWESPRRVRFTWHPGNPPAEATEVEVRFSEQEDGTLVELTHTGWERRPDGLDARRGYHSGWDLVVGQYVSRARSWPRAGTAPG